MFKNIMDSLKIDTDIPRIRFIVQDRMTKKGTFVFLNADGSLASIGGKDGEDQHSFATKKYVDKKFQELRAILESQRKP